MRKIMKEISCRSKDKCFLRSFTLLLVAASSFFYPAATKEKRVRNLSKICPAEVSKNISFMREREETSAKENSTPYRRPIPLENLVFAGGKLKK